MIEKKDWKKNLRGRRATGTIIAASFLVLIIISGYTLTVLLNTQTKELNKVIGEVNMFDWERGNERIRIVGTPFDPDDRLNVTVENIGEVSVDLKWVTVRNASTLRPILNYSPIEVYLRPGEIVDGIGDSIVSEFSGSFEGTTRYVVQVLTSRGTVSSIQHPPLEREYRPVINKIYSGPFEFDQEVASFKYTTKDMDGGLLHECYYYGYHSFEEPSYSGTENPVDSRAAYEMYDFYDHLVFEVNLKNVENRTIEIHQSSFLLVIVPAYQSTGETELYHYIVGPNSNSTQLESATEYTETIAPGERKNLKFAARTQGGTQFLYNNSLRGYQSDCERCVKNEHENLLTTFLVIFWKFQDTNIKFGQTIPLGSVHIQPEGVSMGVHVVDLEGSTESLPGGDWRATVEVTVHDSNDIPLQGAKVWVEWSGISTSQFTGSNGKTTFNTNLDSSIPNVVFSVEDISEIEPEVYTPSYNEDLDGDSDGTTLTLEQP
jgi:hypothetical protein